MKTYFVDTNYLLRFFLKDNKKQFQKAKNYFKKAEQGKINLVILPQVVFEVNYVLKSVYNLSRKKTAAILQKIIASPYFKIEKRSILLNAVTKYKEEKIDLVDFYLSESAKNKKAELLSFDKDFDKIC